MAHNEYNDSTKLVWDDKEQLKEGLRVLVCGGRAYNDHHKVHTVLDKLDVERGPITCVIHGGATGADYEGMFWAQIMSVVSGRKVTPLVISAAWGKYGKAAGPIRNQRMLDLGKPDLVVAFPGGRGTADMVRRARAAGVEVIEVEA